MLGTWLARGQNQAPHFPPHPHPCGHRGSRLSSQPDPSAAAGNRRPGSLGLLNTCQNGACVPVPSWQCPPPGSSCLRLLAPPAPRSPPPPPASGGSSGCQLQEKREVERAQGSEAAPCTRESTATHTSTGEARALEYLHAIQRVLCEAQSKTQPKEDVGKKTRDSQHIYVAFSACSPQSTTDATPIQSMHCPGAGPEDPSGRPRGQTNTRHIPSGVLGHRRQGRALAARRRSECTVGRFRRWGGRISGRSMAMWGSVAIPSGDRVPLPFITLTPPDIH